MLGTYARSAYKLLRGMSMFEGQWQRQSSLKQYLHSRVPYFSAGRLPGNHAFLGLLLTLSNFASPIKGRGAKSLQADRSIVSCSSTYVRGPEELLDRPEDARDTIVALSSGSGRAGVAVIRVSGPRAGAMIGHGAKACTLQWSNSVDAVCLSMPDEACGMQMLSYTGS